MKQINKNNVNKKKKMQIYQINKCQSEYKIKEEKALN